MTRPKPFTTAEMANLPISMPPQEAAAPRMESGVLPGEEQVTTRDVLGRLAPPEQAALQKKYEAGGHAGTLSYDDWLSDNFGDLPPQERAAAMKASATATERVNIGKDPTLPPATNSDLARSRQAAGKPLPEGREPDQYTPEQRRTMSRNVYNPEVPMTRFGGTFTHNVSGSVSERAANPAMLERAEAIGRDQGYGSPSHVAALAQAYNIDAVQYGDDLDLLAADTLREHQRHEAKRQGLDTIPNGMGGFRYAPNAAKAQAALAARDAAMTPRDKARFAESIIRRHHRWITPDEQAAIESLVLTPDGFAKLREMDESLKRRSLQERLTRVANSRDNYNMTRTLNNPNYAPGMQIRSLLQAAEEGNPMALSVMQGFYGNQVGARDAMQAHIAEQANATSLAGAEMAAKPATDADKTLAAQATREIADAMSRPSGQREVMLAIIMRRAGVPEEQIPTAVRNTVLDHEARTNPTSPLVQAELKARSNDEAAFTDFVVNRMGRSREEAKAMWEQASGRSVPAAAAQGQADAQAWRDWWNRQGAYWGGFAGGSTPPAPPAK